MSLSGDPSGIQWCQGLQKDGKKLGLNALCLERAVWVSCKAGCVGMRVWPGLKGEGLARGWWVDTVGK